MADQIKAIMKIAVIGGGNIGGAIALGSVRCGAVVPSDIVVSDPRAPLDEVFGGTGIGVVADNIAAIKGAEFIIVAVKPWLMEQVLVGIAPVIDRNSQAIVSIAAGISFETMRDYLGVSKRGSVPLFRVIPNTAVALGKSATFIASDVVSDEQKNRLEKFFAASGEVYEVEEGQMAAVTSLASSGIAYALKYIDSAVSGAVEMGIDRGEALRMVMQTIRGALALLEANGTQPQEEIDKVTTPNGITVRGLAVMEREGFTRAVIAGLKGE